MRSGSELNSQWMMAEPARRVDDIITCRNGWREIIANAQAFKQYRTQAKRQMQAASITCHRRRYSRSKTEIEKASAPQATMVHAPCATRSG
jgi:hypothetical protein